MNGLNDETTTAEIIMELKALKDVSEVSSKQA